MEGYRWQLLPAHGKKSFLLGASEKLYISACAFKVEFWSWAGFLMENQKKETID